LRPAGSPLQGVDDLCGQRAKRICLHIHLATAAATGKYADVAVSAPIIQWKLRYPCAGFASYPFVDLSFGEMIERTLFLISSH
jgi:hypothetical protein